MRSKRKPKPRTKPVEHFPLTHDPLTGEPIEHESQVKRTANRGRRGLE